MVPKPIKLTTLITTIALVLITEMAAWWMLQHVSSLAIVGLARLVQITAIAMVIIQFEGGLGAVGCAPGTWFAGIKIGALWSIGFALTAGLAMAVVYLLGYNPLAMVRAPMPSRPVELMLLFAVGGLIAPLAEELCFRGVLYTYFRRWGIAFALVASTVIFVALHAVKGLPLTQVVGGLVFAIAYETSGNLMVAITIHTLGNLAIFSLSLV
jgi:uncharacterized protein